jgi:hypothetical protein
LRRHGNCLPQALKFDPPQIVFPQRKIDARSQQSPRRTMARLGVDYGNIRVGAE